MASWLMRLAFFVTGWLFYLWYKETQTQKETSDTDYLQNKLQEWDWLYDNTEVNQAMSKVKSLEVKVEPAEIAQPVSEPTAADLVLDTVKENKW